MTAPGVGDPAPDFELRDQHGRRVRLSSIATITDGAADPAVAFVQQNGVITPDLEVARSRREAEIIALVTSGLSNNEIAERTYVSVKTVEATLLSPDASPADRGDAARRMLEESM